MLYYIRRKQHFPCNLFGGDSYSVGIGKYVFATYISIQRSLRYSISIEFQETLVLHYFLPEW